MPAPPKPPTKLAEERSERLSGLLAAERELLATRIADAPAAWISIPMWGKVFTTGRRLLGLDRRARSR